MARRVLYIPVDPPSTALWEDVDAIFTAGTASGAFRGSGVDGAVVWNGIDVSYFPDGLEFHCTSLTIQGNVRYHGLSRIFCRGTVTIAAGATLTMWPTDSAGAYLPTMDGEPGAAAQGGSMPVPAANVNGAGFQTADTSGFSGGNGGFGGPDIGNTTAAVRFHPDGFGWGGSGGAGGDGSAVPGAAAAVPVLYGRRIHCEPFGLPLIESEAARDMFSGLGGAGGSGAGGDGINDGGGGGSGGVTAGLLNIICASFVLSGDIVAAGGIGGDGETPAVGDCGGGGGGGGGAGGLIVISADSFTITGAFSVPGAAGGAAGSGVGTGTAGAAGSTGEDGSVILINTATGAITITHPV